MNDFADALEDAERRAAGQPPPERASPADAQAEVARLAQLGTLEYEHDRVKVARALGFRTSALDAAVAAARPKG